MLSETDKTLTPARLMSALRDYDFLASYTLAIYPHHEEETTPQASVYQLCSADKGSTIFGAVSSDILKEKLRAAIINDIPMTFCCPTGLRGFVVPLSAISLPDYCLVGSGVREQALDFSTMSMVARKSGVDPISLMEQVSSLPIATSEDVASVAQKVYSLLLSFPRKDIEAKLMEKTMERLNAIAVISREIDLAGSSSQTLSLLCETLGILFDVPAIAVAISDRESNVFSLQAVWGISEEGISMPGERLSGMLMNDLKGRIELTEEDMEEFFPTVKASSATCIPLAYDDKLLGLVALFNVELFAKDLLLVELLTGRAAARLMRFKREEELSKESSLSRELLEVISSLAIIEEQQELFNAILEMAAKLANASCGSLMLMDENRVTLLIEAAIGMNIHLAKSLTTKLGNGIAGKVAVNGQPMLVNDIEKDERITGVNRPRFKTKSFISVPLKFKEQIIGVLNLSDKKDHGIFTESDLDTLTPLVSRFAALIQRSRALATTGTLERLSVTDPLTELFNRRFLDKRIEEELSRSLRHSLHLTVMIVDLDNFKTYNDLCGHIAGDKALKRIARILMREVREMDVVTRYGGEEFCILLPITSKKESVLVAERIRRGVENEKFSGEENLPLGRLTASIGIASFPEDGNSTDMLINTADMALYQAKARGRNCISLAQPSKQEHGNKGDNSDDIKGFPDRKKHSVSILRRESSA
ncbi:MAG: sensor domain-containing diguanylate cyclase [Geobacteraceae bacterium]